ncbi:MAG: 23S rRNA (adenine(2503)-C(2))-methyltransferase RlmN, partial [Verrucomicrobiae bacterium]|nr:23S rRNA (adenine(2503)-C(2))-methyltransferase RlmN [Verrucomicrobiae bacterium]
MAALPPPDLRDLDDAEIAALCRDLGQPAFRARQVLHWLYAARVDAVAAMTNLPQEFRARLAERAGVSLPTVVRTQGAADHARKFLLRLADGHLIETVRIPASPGLYGERADRLTLCVSTQVGCAYGCRFCASGMAGFRRNLAPSEIVGQLLLAEREGKRRVNNLVFMGMGEPLANYANVLRALRILNAPWGIGLGARKVTLSTSGLAPEIERLAAEDLQVRLAVSLHGARDEVRDRIMPVNRRYPLARLMKACEVYQRVKGRMITFEYILLADVNDAAEDAPRLAALARRARAKVNLIPFNAVEGVGFRRPAEERCRRFAAAVARAG